MNKGLYRLVFNQLRGIWMVADESVSSHQTGKNASRLEKRRVARSLVDIHILILGLSIGVMSNVVRADGETININNLKVIQGNITQAVNGNTLNINQASQRGIMQGTRFNIAPHETVNFNHTGGQFSSTLVRISGDRSVIQGVLNSPNGAVHLINQSGVLFADGAQVNVNGLVVSALNIKDQDYLDGHTTAYTRDGRAAYVWEGDQAGYQTVLVQIDPGAKIRSKLGSQVMVFAPKVINKGSIEVSKDVGVDPSGASSQVVMAAGSKVYLSYAPDLNAGDNVQGTYTYQKDSPYRAMAGVLVEVDSLQTTNDRKDDIKGVVTNDVTGRVLAQQGNVTMAGFMVNQNGRVTATSTVNQKGSIRLLARDTLQTRAGGQVYVENVKGGTNSNRPESVADRLQANLQAASADTIITGSNAGALTVGEGSITAVLPEDPATSQLTGHYKTDIAVDQNLSAAQNAERSAHTAAYYQQVNKAINNSDRPTISNEVPFNPSTIEAVGRQVSVNDHAKMIATAGHISISARKDGNSFVTPSEALAINRNVVATEDAESRVYLGKNTLIDASGLKAVDVDLNRNFVERLLTLTDLKNNAVNREEGRFLNRSKVWFDIRNTPDDRVADLAGFVDQVTRSMGEKSAVGGSISIKSQGDIIQRESSKIDVSGGSLKFSNGINKETWLIDLSGRFYALGDAPADTIFTGFYGGQNSINRPESGYTEGMSAGELNIEAYNMVINGQLSGKAIYGERQLEAENLGGKLNVETISAPEGTNFTTADLKTLNLTDNPTPLDDLFNRNTVLPITRREEIDFSANMLNESGFEDISLRVAGTMNVNAPLSLTDGSKLSLTGLTMFVNQNITARGGEVTLRTVDIEQLGGTNLENITIADNVAIDVSGNWINDIYVNSLTRRVIDGGAVNIISAETFTQGKGGLIDVSGGALVDRVGRRDQFIYGNAGAITINTNQGQTGAPDNPYGYQAPTLDGELRGFSFGKGGQVSITAPHITIAETGFNDRKELLITPEFFTEHGFTQFNLIGRDGAIVRKGTQLDISAKNLVLNHNYSAYATGANLNDFSSVQLLPAHLRYATSLTLETQSTVLNQASEPLFAAGMLRGSLYVEQGARIKVDVNGFAADNLADATVPEITLKAWDNQLYVNGELTAPGGKIDLIMNGNPASNEDIGYNNAQVIWLDDQAKLSTKGFVNYNLSDPFFNDGKVVDGGSVKIEANKGYIVTKAGSIIDVSGVSARLDVDNLTTVAVETVKGNAGSVDIKAREGLLLDNTFKAAAEGGLGGKLSVRLGRDNATLTTEVVTEYPGTRGNNTNFDPYLPNQVWTFDIFQKNENFTDNAFLRRSIEPIATGNAKLGLDAIADFRNVTLQSEDVINFVGEINHIVQGNMVLNANTIQASAGVTVDLKAARFALGNYILDAQNPRDNAKQFAPQLANSGTSRLTLQAEHIDVYGNLAVSGFNQTNIESQGGFNFTGFINRAGISTGAEDPTPTSTINFNGQVNLTAKQFSPNTLSNVTINVAGTGNEISFNQAEVGQNYDAVISALGGLTVNARNINQNGVILAPFGQINLNAESTLNLNANSVTSVSAKDALIPFGFTGQEGQFYFYDFGGNVDLQLTSLPVKAVNLNAPTINFNENSKVDISGGGDLFAYEWIPGVGGGRDVLSPTVNQNIFGDNVSNTWAIIKNDAFNRPYANYDIQYWTGTNIEQGSAIYLSNINGLTDGYYTLLPARYALLPGAMLVSQVSGFDNLAAGTNAGLQNGGVIASGHFGRYTVDGYQQSSQRSGFIVRDGADAYKLAQYNTTTATDFFNNQAIDSIPASAGEVTFAATSSLVLKGIIDALPATGGKGARVNVGVPNLLIVGDNDVDGRVTIDGVSFLAIKESSLNNFKAASLLLGGNRDNQKLNVIATEVRLNGNANLVGSEIILAANDKVTLKSGASVTGTGAGGLNESYIIGDNTTSGNGAYLAVSGTSNNQSVTRENVSGNKGSLVVENGALISGDQSIVIDNTLNSSFNGQFDFNPGASIFVGAKRISLGSPANGDTVVDGFVINGEQLNKFTTAGNLTLNSQSSIDLYGAVSFGNDDLSLSVNASGMTGYQNSNTVSKITAKTFSFQNNSGVGSVNAPALAGGRLPVRGNGAIDIQAKTITGGDGQFALGGFNDVALQASESIIFNGNQASTTNAVGNQLSVDQNLSVKAPILTTADSAHYKVQASNGLLTIAGASNSNASLGAVSSTASDLTLQGDRVVITDHALIDARSAATTIIADGTTASDSVTIDNGAKIEASGASYRIFDEEISLSAGQVSITSQNGNVDINTSTMIDLSASGDASAGKLSLSAANGNVAINGDITVNAGSETAEVSVDTGSVSQFSQIINQLADFKQLQTYRVRNGDVALSSGDTIQSKQIEISADKGNITIAGTLDASGATGGNVAIYARDNVNLADGGRILANATSAKNTGAGNVGNGGDVLLSSSNGQVKTGLVAAGTMIDVSGNQTGAVAGQNGQVNFRAQRTNANTGVGDGVNIDSNVAAVVKGADKVLLEAVKTYDVKTINAAQTLQFANDTNQFIANFDDSRFDSTSDGVKVSLAPSIDVKVDGDINFTNDWIIGYENYRQVFSNQPRRDGLITDGFLNLRATGNVKINGDISYEQMSSLQPDGSFYIINNQYQVYDQSWSYRFVAGLDDSAANINAVKANSGNLEIGNNVVIRTGTGSIAATAGNDITIGRNSAIYTEGKPLTEDVVTSNGFTSIGNNFGAQSEFYAEGGGDVILTAGNDVVGSGTNLPRKLTEWFRHGGLDNDTAVNKQLRWYANFNGFADGIGALGGGNVKVRSNGNISNLQFASASSARISGAIDQAPIANNIQTLGGGDVDVFAAESIDNVLLHAGKGNIQLSAKGTINDAKVSLIDGSANLTANQSVEVNNVTNPTIERAVDNTQRFYSYASDAEINVTSLAGDIIFGNPQTVGGDITFIATPTIKLAAASGDISANDFVMFPSANGNLTMLAGENIQGFGGQASGVVMSDVNPNSLVNLLTASPTSINNISLDAFQGANAHQSILDSNGNAVHLHSNDVNPVKVYAINDVNFNNLSFNVDAKPVVLPKETIIKAGGSINDPNLIVQNVNEQDVSILEAGKDVRYREAFIQGNRIIAQTNGIQIAGPGRLHIAAGKDVDFGVSTGVRSVGNIYNPNLADTGADVYIQAGATGIRDHVSFIERYLESGAALSATYLPQLASYMQTRTGEALTETDALAQFKGLDYNDQIAFINEVFYLELRDGSREALTADPTSPLYQDYSRPNRAILTLFPEFTNNTALATQSGSIHDAFAEIANETPRHSGDLTLFSSQVKSERGGRIELMLPYGRVVGGLAVSSGLDRPDSDQGVLSLRGGELYGLVRTDFLVNQSRVFTLGGSDLMLYSALSNIDAGKGAKTASATPPPVLRIVDGQIIYDYSSAVSGSGIAALTSTGGEPGTVDLYAPYGQIDAGEAGIRVEGNAFLGAQTVVGADNISVSGASAGVTVSVAGVSIAAPVAAGANSNDAKNSAMTDEEKKGKGKDSQSPSLFTVEVIALEDAAPGDEDKDKKDKL
jgi:filamentous hemagglutinin